ncbi:unnamed protein product [Mycena citricolor]|uniref:Uncharacterized protein n=1 Tax=Mycena citricolor TaxID=2018698 RepID=A0AAD2H103_9AGAR|nr:unnamed protein product [Mycena citricolor]
MVAGQHAESDLRKRVESEMPRHQQNLVDTCLEEGQYQSAIHVLNELRSPFHRPSASHIRQLLYMALYTSLDTLNTNSSASPSKRQKKAHLLPTPDATAAAQELLVSFAMTNSPHSVMRALRPADQRESLNADEADCFVAAQSLCISRSKHCWEILSRGFLADQRVSEALTRRGRSRATSGSTGDSLRSEVVGENAWPVLHWLLIIFKRDEEENELRPRHSILLLEQLGTPTRRDTDAVLDVMLFCLEQSDNARCMMGLELMSLLINLSATSHLDFPLLVAGIFNRLSGTFSVEQISSILSGLASSPAVNKFKVAFYQKYLDDSAVHARPVARPRPLARANGKAPPVTAQEPATPAVASLANKFRGPPASDIMRLMQTSTSSPGVSPLRIKFEMLQSYHAWQTQLPQVDRDAEWAVLLENGRVSETLDAVFGSSGQATGEGGDYRDLLDIILKGYS